MPLPVALRLATCGNRPLNSRPGTLEGSSRSVFQGEFHHKSDTSDLNLFADHRLRCCPGGTSSSFSKPSSQAVCAQGSACRVPARRTRVERRSLRRPRWGCCTFASSHNRHDASRQAVCLDRTALTLLLILVMIVVMMVVVMVVVMLSNDDDGAVDEDEDEPCDID